MEKYTAIITEPRIHPAWKLVLNNFLTNLDERWNFLIFCGLLNKDFLVELIDTNFKEHKHRITIYQLNIDNFNDVRKWLLLCGQVEFVKYESTQKEFLTALDSFSKSIS